MYIVLHLFQVSMQYWLGTLRLLLAHLQEGGPRILTHNHGVCPAATTVNAECLMPLNSVWRCVLWVLSELSEFKIGIITSITRPDPPQDHWILTQGLFNGHKACRHVDTVACLQVGRGQTRQGKCVRDLGGLHVDELGDGGLDAWHPQQAAPIGPAVRPWDMVR